MVDKEFWVRVFNGIGSALRRIDFRSGAPEDSTDALLLKSARRKDHHGVAVAVSLAD